MLSRLPAPLAAQLLLVAVAVTPAQEPTAGVRTEIVRLGAVVTDTSGKPISNLTREDFQVLEDGKPQRITNFVLVGRRHAPSTEPGTAGTARSGVPAEADSPPTRHVVIVVDDLHMACETVDPAREALLRFVGEQVAAEDELALVMTSSPACLQSLTQDRAVFRQANSRISSRDAPGTIHPRATASTPFLWRGFSPPHNLRLAAFCCLTLAKSALE